VTPDPCSACVVHSGLTIYDGTIFHYFSSMPLLLTKKSASSVVTLPHRPGMPSHGDTLATYPPFFIDVQLIHDSSSLFLFLMCKVSMHINKIEAAMRKKDLSSCTTTCGS
jgi:hypothetical protein